MALVSLVEIRDVSKAFGGVRAVSRVSLDVQEGEILSIIGPNGAGKTTLLNCISSVFHPETGTIRLDGHELTRLSPPRVAALGVARTFQNIALFRGMTVVDNLMLGRHIHMKNGVLRSMLYWGPGRREEGAHRRVVMDISRRVVVLDLGEKIAEGTPAEVKANPQVVKAYLGTKADA